MTGRRRERSDRHGNKATRHRKRRDRDKQERQMGREDKQERQRKQTQKQRADGKRSGEERQKETVGVKEKMYVSALHLWQNSTLGSQPCGAPASHFPASLDCRLFPQPTELPTPPSVRMLWCLPQGTVNSSVETSLVFHSLPLR